MNAQTEAQPIENACFKRADRRHCEHWEEDGQCCDCGAVSSSVCSLCGAADCVALTSDTACPNS